MKVYLLESKSFFKSNGCDYQVADMGTIPAIYTSKNKALKHLRARVKLNEDLYSETWKKIQSEQGQNEWLVVERWSFESERYNTRQYLTLYVTETI